MYKLTICICASLCLIFFVSKVVYGETCDKVINNCECVLKNNSVIDLTSTANNNGTPRYSFLNIKDASNHSFLTTEYFFFNPCFPFSLGSEFPSSDKVKNCINDFGCIYHLSDDDKHQEVVISSNVKPTFTSSNLVYKENEKSLKVILHCNETAEEANVEEVLKNGNEYTLNLTTKCACADGCHAPEPTPEPKSSGSKLSTGSILLIVFFTFLVIYIIGGIIWNGYCLGASGIEMLPNLEFWREFPALVTDGARFTVQCCMNRTTTYDSV